jgi:hypothetical protein
MGRFGCVLMMLGALVFAVVIVLPVLLADNPSINHLMERMLCFPDEVYRTAPNTAPSGSLSFNLAASCVRDNAVGRDVTGEQTTYGMVGFAAPFAIGLVLFIYGIARARRAVIVSDNDLRVPLTGHAATDEALTARIRQLADDYSNRLISRAEFEAARRRAIEEANR